MKPNSVLRNFKVEFENKNYEKALEILVQNKTNFEESVFYYNKALVHLRLENFSKSKLFILKSIKAGYDSTESRKILKDSNEYLLVTSNNQPETIVDNLIYYTGFIGPDLLILLFLFVFMVLVLNLKKFYGLFLKAISFAFILIPLLGLVYYKYSLISYVSVEDREVRAGPSSMFDDTFEMPAGINYVISKRYGKWGYIIFPEKYSGWIILNEDERI